MLRCYPFAPLHFVTLLFRSSGFTLLSARRPSTTTTELRSAPFGFRFSRVAFSRFHSKQHKNSVVSASLHRHYFSAAFCFLDFCKFCKINKAFKVDLRLI